MFKKDRLIKTFLELVQIDSPSDHEEEIADELIKRLDKLGFTTQKDSYGNVIGKLDGEGEPIILNAHMDTVEPGRGIKPIIDGDIIRTDQSTVLGADPKAGVAAILEGLTSVIEEKSKHLPIEVVFTRQEEIGLVGAINLDYSKISATRGITVDNGEGVDNIMIAAPGYNRFDLKIIGRGAHAGAEPEKGISSIKIAADIISKLEVGRIDHETTANIGLISGGTARNAVPETVEINGEIRSRDLKKLEKHSEHFQDVINQAIQSNPEAKFELELHREFDPYIFDEQHRVIKLIKDTLEKIGLKARLEPSGGGTDVNIFHTHGIEIVCVGAGAHQEHTTREFAKISEILDAAKFCEKLITTL